MDYKVRKGLETPLYIQGMHTQYFYIWCALAGLLALLCLSSLISAISEGGSFWTFFGVSVFCAVTFLGLRLYFMSKSVDKRFKKFNKRPVTISNKDLLTHL